MSNLKLNIRLQDNILKTNDDKFVIFDRSKSFITKNVLVAPLYALPNDIIDVFAEEVGDYENVLYRYLFEGSIEADQQIGPDFQNYFRLDSPTMFYIKRRYVIAYATWKFAQVFYRDYLKSVKKSKFLADVKVSLEIERDPDLIMQIMKDAKQALAQIAQVVDALSNMRGFSKGEANIRNSKAGARLWLPSLGNNRPDTSMATAKTFFGGKIYKGGDQLDYGVRWNTHAENTYVRNLVQF